MTGTEVALVLLLQVPLSPLLVYLGVGEAPTVWVIIGGGLLLLVLLSHEVLGMMATARAAAVDVGAESARPGKPLLRSPPPSPPPSPSEANERLLSSGGTSASTLPAGAKLVAIEANQAEEAQIAQRAERRLLEAQGSVFARCCSKLTPPSCKPSERLEQRLFIGVTCLAALCIGLTFGWGPFATIMEGEGVFASLCDSSGTADESIDAMPRRCDAQVVATSTICDATAVLDPK